MICSWMLMTCRMFVKKQIFYGILCLSLCLCLCLYLWLCYSASTYPISLNVDEQVLSREPKKIRGIEVGGMQSW